MIRRILEAVERRAGELRAVVPDPDPHGSVAVATILHDAIPTVPGIGFRGVEGGWEVTAPKGTDEAVFRDVVARAREAAAAATTVAEKAAGPDFETLEKHGVGLTDEERAEVMRRKATWHHGPKGEETPAVRKSTIDGEDWYWCGTHRSWSGAKPTLAGAVNAYHRSVKRTS